MSKDLEWLNNEVEKRIKKIRTDEVSFVGIEFFDEGYIHGMRDVQAIANQLGEPEILSQEWINRHTDKFVGNEGFRFVNTNDLQTLLVPKQEEVDRAYKDGYEKGKEYTFYKGYLEGLADKEGEPETVADVIADFYKSLERLKKVLGTEVEELE